MTATRAPRLKVRFTQSEALKALELPADAPLVQYAEAVGIALGRGDTLSESQIRAISDYLDSAMVQATSEAVLLQGARRARGPVRAVRT